MSRIQRRDVSRRYALWVEKLETRRLLCGLPHEFLISAPEFDWGLESRAAARGGAEGIETEIIWVNRGQADDNFTATFGTRAGAARAVVDAALRDWSRVINDWNRDDGTTTLQINISISGNGFGGAGAPDRTAPADGKPRTGSFTIGAGDTVNFPGANDSNGWYFDPNPNDHTEFDAAPISAYAANSTTALGPDLYNVVSAELTHVLGLISDKFNNGADWNGYRLESSGLATNTGIADNADGGGNGVFWVFDGPTVDHLLTSFSSGDVNPTSWGNVVHSAGPGGNINFAGKNWRGAADSGNASINANRTIPAFAMAHMLADAYGYGINEPQNFGSFYMMRNADTGELLVRGGAGMSNDDITIEMDGTAVRVTVDVGTDTPGTGAFSGAQNLPAFQTTFLDVTSITIDAFGGDDVIRIEEIASGKPIIINAGDGNDSIRIGDLANTLNQIDSDITIFGGTGTNTVILDDSTNDAVDDTYTFDNAASPITFDRGGFPLVSMTSIQEIELRGSGGFETVNINRILNSTVDLTVFASGGNDILNVSPVTNDLDQVQGDIFFFGEAGTDTVNLLDTADTTNSVFTYLTSGSNEVLDRGGGFGNLTVNGALEILNLSTGSGASTFNVSALDGAADFTINAGNGNDTLNLGPANNDIGAIQGDVIFNGQAGTDSVIISDSLPFQGLTYTMTAHTFNRSIFGLLTYDTLENMTINGAAGACTYNIDPSGVGLATDVTINAQASTDTFRVTPTAQSMQFVVNADLTFNGGNGADAMTLFDGSSSVSFPYSLDLDSVFRGISPINFTSMETIVVNGATGNNDFGVSSLNATTAVILNGGSGNDRLFLGGAAMNLDNIDGPVTFNGDEGTDSIELRDQNFASATTWTLSGMTADRFGFSLLTYETVEAVTVNGGSGATVVYNVRSTPSGVGITINGGSGGDSFNLGDLTNHVEPLDGPLTINGQGGSDAININDQAEIFSFGFTVNPTTVTRTGVGTITYGTVERLTINSGSTATIPKSHTVNDTAPTTPVRINPGAGTETIHVMETSGAAVQIGPSAGNDTVNVNTSGVGVANVFLDSSLTLAALNIGVGGLVTLDTPSTLVLRTSNLTVNGTLDLTNNAMIVDYSTSSPLASIRSALTSGYANGAWTGNGINSSKAAANPGFALGYAEAAAIFSSFPAVFAGQQIDNTTVLVRYTFYGDADLDRVVNLNDFNRLAANFGATGAEWSQGNFNFDNATNLNDFNLLAANFGQSASPAAWGTPVPTPTVEAVFDDDRLDELA